jgi:hypothetical protein
MTNTKEKDPWKEVFGFITAVNQNYVNARDNIFSANHRGAMVRQYGYTEAMRIKIGDLI